jgi:hypothetical protein
MSEEQVTRITVETDEGIPEEIVIEVETEVIGDEASVEGSPTETSSDQAGEGVQEANATETGETAGSPVPTRDPREEAIYTIRLLTAVAVGGVVEGTDQLVTRLKRYEEKLKQAAEEGEAGDVEIDEDELDRLRYATIGLIFETQNMLGRSLELAVKAAETGVVVTEKIAGPFWDFFLFRPFTKRIEKRFDNMAERGQGSLSRWIEIGREVEPRGRELASLTYEEIIGEFIDRLAESPEIRELVTQQSLSLAAGVRDEVRERTVTSDNVLEDIARRILRREPRTALPEPPPQVQRWAGISPEEFKELENKTDEQRSDTAE